MPRCPRRASACGPRSGTVGFDYPLSRITVNLAPADRRKHGAAYDLAIALGILVASEQIRASSGSWALLGELSLGGEVRAGSRRSTDGPHAGSGRISARRRPGREPGRGSAGRRCRSRGCRMAWTTRRGWSPVRAAGRRPRQRDEAASTCRPSQGARLRRAGHRRSRAERRRRASARSVGSSRPGSCALGARDCHRRRAQPAAGRTTRSRQDAARADRARAAACRSTTPRRSR